MAVGKEIRTKISSIKNTQKITKAMEMVAASKMRKAQDRMVAARPYAARMRQVVAHLAQANAEFQHPYMEARPVKRVGLIIVSSDRGLCGGLNANLFRNTLAKLKEFQAAGTEVDLTLIGNKAMGFFSRVGGRVVSQTSGLGDTPHLEELIGSVRVMLDAFDNGEIDALYLVCNEFVNSMTQKPRFDQVLPLPPVEDGDLGHHWDYIYEPDAQEVVEALLVRYIESQVYQGVVENVACEQAARMVAMKAASDNAGKLIDELQLVYNKARQAAITQELSEIVAGADAV